MAEVGGIAGEKLRSYIERIERLEAEKSALAADIREIFADAKGNGFDAKIMRQIVRLRKMDHQDRAEQVWHYGNLQQPLPCALVLLARNVQFLTVHQI